MHPRVWEASGHVASFSDPLLDCKECKMRHRADNLIDDFDPNAHADGMTKESLVRKVLALSHGKMVRTHQNVVKYTHQ